MFIRFGPLILILVFSSIGYCQVTDQDKSDAVKRAHEFTQQFRRTQDLESLFHDFFIEDFMRQAKEDNAHNLLAILNLPGHRVNLTDKQARRYYIASQNWIYLTWLYNCWRAPKTLGNDDVAIKDRPFPRGVKERLEKTFFRLVLHLDQADELDESKGEKMIPQTPAEVEAGTDILEDINGLYRRDMGPIRDMSDVDFEKMIGRCSGDQTAFYDVEMANCNTKGDCPGVPKGVPLIGVALPPFDFVDFARLNGKMTIVRLLLSDEGLK